MQKCGIEIGAHTLTHADLTRLSDDRVKAEICDSKKVIEDTLGQTVSCFAYPFGRFDSRSREIARQNFDCACSDRLGISTAQSDIYALERVDAYYLRSARAFDLMTGRLFSGYVWSRSIPRRIRRLLQSQS
jgi:peptidoglycan/xylan/chitin deacetylase (PgdA/CDA1 family)